MPNPPNLTEALPAKQSDTSQSVTVVIKSGDSMSKTRGASGKMDSVSGVGRRRRLSRTTSPNAGELTPEQLRSQIEHLKREAKRFGELMKEASNSSSDSPVVPVPLSTSTPQTRKRTNSCKSDGSAASSGKKRRRAASLDRAVPVVVVGDQSIKSAMRSPTGEKKMATKRVRMTVDVPTYSPASTARSANSSLGTPTSSGAQSLMSPRRRSTSDGERLTMNRRRSQSYDIDEVVSPYMRRSMASVRVIEHKEIVIPGLKIIDEADTTLPSDESSGEESTSDEAFKRHHHPLESKERLQLVPGGSQFSVKLADDPAGAAEVTAIGGLSRGYFDLGIGDEMETQMMESLRDSEMTVDGRSPSASLVTATTKAEQTSANAAQPTSSVLFPNRVSALATHGVTGGSGGRSSTGSLGSPRLSSRRRFSSGADLGSPVPGTPSRRTSNTFALKFEQQHRYLSSKSYIAYAHLTPEDREHLDSILIGGPDRFVGWEPREQWPTELDQVRLQDRKMWESHGRELSCNKTSMRREPPCLSLHVIEEVDEEEEAEEDDEQKPVVSVVKRATRGKGRCKGRGNGKRAISDEDGLIDPDTGASDDTIKNSPTRSAATPAKRRRASAGAASGRKNSTTKASGGRTRAASTGSKTRASASSVGKQDSKPSGLVIRLRLTT